MNRTHKQDDTFIIEKNGYPYHVIPGMEEYLDLLSEYSQNPELFIEESVLTTSSEDKSRIKRDERDAAIERVVWRVQRYDQQKSLQILCTDSEETYKKLLQYIQSLRDITEHESFPEITILSFEDWLSQEKNLSNDVQHDGEQNGQSK